jgi:hypothetical protein
VSECHTITSSHHHIITCAHLTPHVVLQALDEVNNILWVSSLNRRSNILTHSLNTNGHLRPFDISTDQELDIWSVFPPNFHPHGLAIAQGCAPLEQESERVDEWQRDDSTVTRLFAISHTTSNTHTIEIFDFYYSPTSACSATTCNATTCNATTCNATTCNATTCNATTCNATTCNATTCNATTCNATTCNATSAVLKPVKTLKHRYLTSPNDLIALTCDEIIVSNDLPKGNIFDVFYALYFGLRGSTLVHHHVKNNQWTTLAESHTEESVHATLPRGMKRRMSESRVTPKTTVSTTTSRYVLASFGNGLLTLPHRHSATTDLSSFPSLLLRSSSIDYTLQQYQLNHTHTHTHTHTSTKGRVKLALQYDVVLPISPDNIEPSPFHPMEVLITGHSSLAHLLLHALPIPFPFRPVSPSVVLRYNALFRNYTVVYYSSGSEISASSVAVMVRSNSVGSCGVSECVSECESESDGNVSVMKLYIGQVFDSFILSCPMVT